MADSSNSLDGVGSSHSCDTVTSVPNPFEQRPDRISITIQRDHPLRGLGISLDEFGRIISTESGLLIVPSPTIPDEFLLQTNDVVESINGLPWDPAFRNELDTACGSLVFVFQTNVAPTVELQQEEGLNNDADDHPVTSSPTTKTTLKQSLMNQAVVVWPETNQDPIRHGILLRPGRQKTVWIARISADIWKFSVLQPNQRILAVGSTVAPATRQQTYELLECLPRVLSITTFGRKPGSWSLRKAAVGVGGSAMVGVGAVLMVTPLHPVGHVMAVSGMGVLGTEFEAPRQAMKYPRKAIDYTKSKLFRTTSKNETPGAEAEGAEKQSL